MGQTPPHTILNHFMTLKVRKSGGMVRFNKFSVRYPKHVMLELKGYLTKKDKAEQNSFS